MGDQQEPTPINIIHQEKPNPTKPVELTPQQKQAEIDKRFSDGISLYKGLMDEGNFRRQNGFTFQLDLDSVDRATTAYAFEKKPDTPATEEDVRKAELLSLVATLQSALSGLTAINQGVNENPDSLDKLLQIYKGGQLLANELATTRQGDFLRATGQLFTANKVTVKESTPEVIHQEVLDSYEVAGSQVVNILSQVIGIHSF